MLGVMWLPVLLTYFAQRIDEAFPHGGDVERSEVIQGNPEYLSRKNLHFTPRAV